ncbi:hypothetical protein ABH922_005029 [Rhodococcus sp. 27YEA15]
MAEPLQAHLPLPPTRAHSTAIGLDEDQGQSPSTGITGSSKNRVEVGEAAVGDEPFGPVDDPLVAVSTGGRRDSGKVGAVVGFRGSNRTQQLTGGCTLE